MTLVDSSLLSNAHPPGHIMIKYDDSQKLDNLVSTFINEGLKRNQLCIYATILDMDNTVKKLQSMITDYKENIKNGNLLMINLKEFYIPTLHKNLEQFENLKKLVLDKIKDRDDKHVRIYGDLVSFCFKNKHFDECICLEKWWQKEAFEGTAICPYHNSLFEKDSFEKHEDQVVHTHDDVLYC